MKKLITFLILALTLAAVAHAQSAAPAPVTAGTSQKVTGFIKAKVSDVYGTKSVTFSPVSIYKVVSCGQEAEKKARYFGTLLNVLVDLKPAEDADNLVRTRWDRAYDNVIASYKQIQSIKHSPGFEREAIHYTIYKTNTTFGGKSRTTYVAWDSQYDKAAYLYFENDGVVWNKDYTQVPDDFDLLEFLRNDPDEYTEPPL